MQYTIYSFHNAESLAGLFNGIASIFGSTGFKGAIAMMLVLGFSAALFAMVFARDRLVGPKWLASVVLINAILFVPKATIQVVDQVGLQPPQIIDNVPWGLAVQASLVSSTGKVITQLFETAFQTLPKNPLEETLSYSKNGLMFGAKLIKNSRQVMFDDLNFRSEMVNFIKNCTLYDLSQGRIDSVKFTQATASPPDDLWTLMANTNAARFTPIQTSTGIDAVTCPTAYASLNGRLGDNINSLEKKLGVAMYPWLRSPNTGQILPESARSLIEIALPQAYSRAKIGSAAADAAILLRQNALINAVGEAGRVASQASNDPSAMLLGLSQAQATAQLNTQYLTSMKLAQETLPLLRNSIEAVTYAMFPLMLLLAFLFGGVAAWELLKSYGLVLVWVAMWPPLYAVVNFLALSVAERNIAAAGYTGGNTVGLSLDSAANIFSTSINELGAVGMLMLSVPAIAGAIVFGLNKLAGVAASAANATMSAASGGTNPASSGNLNLGNVNMDKIQLDSQKTQSALESQTDIYGTVSRDSSTGEARYTTSMGSNAVGLKSLDSLQSTNSESSTRATQAAESFSRQADAATASTLNNAFAAADSISSGSTSGTGVREGQTTGYTQQVSALRQISEQLGKDIGISDKASAIASTVTSIGFDTPILKAKLAQEGKLTSTNDINESVKKANSALQSAGISDSSQLLNDFVRSDEFRRYGQTNAEQAKRVESGFQQSQSLRESAQRSFKESDTYALAAQNARILSQSGSYDWVRDFNNFVAGKGFDPRNLSASQSTEQMQSFLSSGEAVKDYRGEPSIVPFKNYGPSSINSNQFADKEALRDRTGGELNVGGRVVNEASLRGTKAANDANVGRNSRVSTQGLPTQAGLEKSGREREEYQGDKRRETEGRQDSTKQSLENELDKKWDGSSTDKLGLMNATQQVKKDLGRGDYDSGRQKASEPYSWANDKSAKDSTPAKRNQPTE